MSVAQYLKPQPRLVTKASGATEPFDIAKIERWAPYAKKHGVDWARVVKAVEMQLPSKVTSTQVHETLVTYCLAGDDIYLSRMASVLVQARVRKNIARKLGISADTHFFNLAQEYFSRKLWSPIVYNRIRNNQAVVQSWYEELRHTEFESWQVIQWCDKYSLKIDEQPVETPVIGAIALAIAILGVTPEGERLARAIALGKINLPTPTLNGCRNGDFDSISCSVITGGDTVDSIGVASHLAYKMTAKKAGIGIELATRAKGADVKGGRIKHLGKQPLYANIDTAVKMFTQVGRGGSATVTFSVYDPDVMELLSLKSQRTPLDIRLDKLDYSLSYDDAFVDAVVKDAEYQTKCVSGMLGKVYKARDVLKRFLQLRQETGRLYCFNHSVANTHTPFIDEIRLSNLCQEIALPTAPFTNMYDLEADHGESDGEIAFCALAAINVARVSEDEYEDIAYLTVLTVDNLITKAPALTPRVRAKMQSRRSLGIGITGLADWLGQQGASYSDADLIESLAERHYYYLLKGSQRLVTEHGREPVSGIKTDWLPIDTKRTTRAPTLDWEALRGKPRRNSVLVAHMPTESSAVFSNATNGLYPVRNTVVKKASRHGLVAYIAPAYVRERAWDIPNDVLISDYAAVQAYTDQAISADYYYVPSRHPDGKVPMSQLMKEWVKQARAGIKTMYYSNTEDFNGGAFSDIAQQDAGCASGGCKL